MFFGQEMKGEFRQGRDRESKAPAGPSLWVTLIGRSGSADALPSVQGVAIDFLRTGLPYSHH
jgi:hypothetical protein